MTSFERKVAGMAVCAAGLLSSAAIAQVESSSDIWVQAPPKKTTFGTPEVTIGMDLALRVPVVTVRVQGKGPYRFVLGTAARGTAIDNDIVRDLGLRTVGKSWIDDAFGGFPREVDRVAVTKLRVGTVIFRDFEAVSVDLDEEAGGRRKYDGILGLPLFWECLLTINYPDALLTIAEDELPPADGKEILDCSSDGGRVSVRLDFDGAAADVAIDTTARRVFVLAKSLQSKVRLTAGSTPRKMTKLRSSFIIRESELPHPAALGTVMLGRHKLVEPLILFEGAENLMGIDLLKHFVVTVDQRNERVRLARASDEPIRFAPRARFGFVLLFQAGRLIIQDTVPGSPAARYNFQPGDVITQIDGKRTVQWQVREIRDLLKNASDFRMTVESGGFPMILRIHAAD